MDSFFEHAAGAMKYDHEHLKSVDTEVLIVGAGIAGLYSAYRLLQANVPFIVIESSDHAGGRIYSRPEKHSHLGLILDEGANLINSTDTLAIRLMDRFGIPYVRRVRPGADSMHYLVGGQEFSQSALDTLLFQENRTAINIIMSDQDRWRSDLRHDITPEFVNESIASYLGKCGAGPYLKAILKSFFWSEYGRDLEELNLHVLFDYVRIDLACPCFKLIPNVDEAYTVPSGTGQIVDRLEAACHLNIAYGRRVLKIEDSAGVMKVTASDSDGRIGTWTARHVFFAAPLHSLRDISVSVAGLSPEAVAKAAAATYARGTKLHFKFLAGFHNIYRYTGILLTDTGEQIWPSSIGQGGAGLLTVLTGPLPPGRAIAVEHTGRVLQALDHIYPGLSDLFVSMERTDAPMSYSGALRPGEVAHPDIHNGGARWTTIGEASSDDLQGYLEGALRSADEGASRYILDRRIRGKERKQHRPQRTSSTILSSALRGQQEA